jgi:hypothetical protein
MHSTLPVLDKGAEQGKWRYRMVEFARQRAQAKWFSGFLRVPERVEVISLDGLVVSGRSRFCCGGHRVVAVALVAVYPYGEVLLQAGLMTSCSVPAPESRLVFGSIGCVLL